jgi:hypothetical protein
VNSQSIDSRLIEILNRASSLELFQLNTLIEHMLADPRRIIAVRTNMHMGQTVRFVDWRDGQMRNGRVVAMSDAKVTLHEDGTRIEWKLPYTAIEPPQATGGAAAKPSPPQAAAQLKPGRGEFRCGEKVSFEDKYLKTQVGIVVRINQRTATVDTGDGHSWRVGFPLLRHVLDI